MRNIIIMSAYYKVLPKKKQQWCRYLYELEDAVSRVVPFIFVHRGAVKDDRRRIGLDVVLKERNNK